MLEEKRKKNEPVKMSEVNPHSEILFQYKHYLSNICFTVHILNLFNNNALFYSEFRKYLLLIMNNSNGSPKNTSLFIFNSQKDLYTTQI